MRGLGISSPTHIIASSDICICICICIFIADVYSPLFFEIGVFRSEFSNKKNKKSKFKVLSLVFFFLR